jgi:RNA polymerase sigma-70 factor (ECF subfamily)
VSSAGARQALATTYRTDGRRALATLIRLLGGFDAAEDALQDAMVAATEQWSRDGVPDNPYSWLVSTGRHKAIDRWRRQARTDEALLDFATLADAPVEPESPVPVEDDELRLIFLCCHPALSPDARIALTLREVGGLTTEEIARAYLVAAPTIAQRIVRAKAKIRDGAIAYEIPTPAEVPSRLDSVLQVIYLIFNEGYLATDGPALIREDLCVEALRLGRLVVELLDDSEAQGLLALMLLHHARVAGRTDGAGNLILLEDQDRTKWDHAVIEEADTLLERALACRRVGPYVLQAAIVALHAQALSFDRTDWSQIVALYDVLIRLDRSPVVALNRAIALGMRDGWAKGLEGIQALMRQGALSDYHLAHAARADMLRRLGRSEEALASYLRALELTRQPAERRFLQWRVAQLAPAARFG